MGSQQTVLTKRNIDTPSGRIALKAGSTAAAAWASRRY